MYNPVVPWSEIRKLVNIEYLPDIFEYIHNIPYEDLKEFEDHCRMKRYEQEQFGYAINKRDADWSDKLKVVMVEIRYRQVHNIKI